MTFYKPSDKNESISRKPWQVQHFRSRFRVGTGAGEVNLQVGDVIKIGEIANVQAPVNLHYIPSVADATLAFDATIAIPAVGLRETGNYVYTVPGFFGTGITTALALTPENTNLQRNNAARAYRSIGESITESYPGILGSTTISANDRLLWDIILVVTAVATGSLSLNFHGIFFPNPDVKF